MFYETEYALRFTCYAGRVNKGINPTGYETSSKS